jgi:DNA-binding NarL/FixJ family response regulator
MPINSTTKSLKFLVVDDHAIVCRGLTQVIADEWQDAEVQETATGQGAIDAVRQCQWNMIILDVNLPDKNGIEVLKDLKAVKPALPVLVLSHHSETQYAARAYKAGAAAYLTKDRAPEELVAAIRKALAGGRYVSPSFAESLAGRLTGDFVALPHEILSDREHLVLCLLAQGKTVSAIAQDLSLSVNTISTYRARLLSKLHVQNNAELMRYAFDHELVE